MPNKIVRPEVVVTSKLKRVAPGIYVPQLGAKKASRPGR